MQETGNNKIDFSKSEQYTLSIRLSTDGFSFSIYNPIHESSLSFFEKETNASLSLTANLKQFFRETEFLTLPYRRVNILMADKRFTHVPTDFFEEEQAGILFYHNHSPKENEIVLHNVLSRSNVTVIFGMDRSAYLFLKEQYPEARLGNSKKMYVSLRKNAMDLFCYERGHLLLANSFECEQTADRIYYLLYIWKQLGFDQERDELHLTGILADKENLVTELRKFILQVFIMNPETNIDIQALLTCE